MMKNMMAAQGGGGGGMNDMPMTLELAPKHELVKTLHAIKDTNPEVAKLGAECLFDNATIAAGLLDEPRNVLPRMNKMLQMFVDMGAGEDFSVIKEKMEASTSTTGSSTGTSTSSDDDGEGGEKVDAEKSKEDVEELEKLAKENLESVQKAADAAKMSEAEEAAVKAAAGEGTGVTEKTSTPHTEESTGKTAKM